MPWGNLSDKYLYGSEKNKILKKKGGKYGL